MTGELLPGVPMCRQGDATHALSIFGDLGLDGLPPAGASPAVVGQSQEAMDLGFVLILSAISARCFIHFFDGFERHTNTEYRGMEYEALSDIVELGGDK